MLDHPRIRGEHLVIAVDWDRAAGSSPHTRGAPLVDGVNQVLAVDHPRIRGEHSDVAGRPTAARGSSPHTRGAPILVILAAAAARIIPAYAGSTAMSECAVSMASDHPRIRGEHVAEIPGKIVKAGSSPHTRGAPVGVEVVGEGSGIIPAYAGSTASFP